MVTVCAGYGRLLKPGLLQADVPPIPTLHHTDGPVYLPTRILHGIIRTPPPAPSHGTLHTEPSYPGKAPTGDVPIWYEPYPVIRTGLVNVMRTVLTPRDTSVSMTTRAGRQR